ncbi:MAG: hypothetical protein HYW02_08025, partial [Deltaproteobacteria bacterium]|nr:hypothetical protein [Deltaproteobacteria bacterium]
MKLIQKTLIIGSITLVSLFGLSSRSYASFLFDMACGVLGGPAGVAACHHSSSTTHAICQAVTGITGLYHCSDSDAQEELINDGCTVAETISNNYVYCEEANPLSDDLAECQEDLEAMSGLSDNCEGAWGALFGEYMTCRAERSDLRSQRNNYKDRLDQICKATRDPEIREIAGCVDPLALHPSTMVDDLTDYHLQLQKKP